VIRRGNSHGPTMVRNKEKTRHAYEGNNRILENFITRLSSTLPIVRKDWLVHYKLSKGFSDCNQNVCKISDRFDDRVKPAKTPHFPTIYLNMRCGRPMITVLAPGEKFALTCRVSGHHAKRSRSKLSSSTVTDSRVCGHG